MSGGQGLCLGLRVVAGFGFGRWNVSDRSEQASVVILIHPLQGGELHGLEAPPWTTPVDHLGLEQAVDRLGQGIDAPMSVKS